MTRSEIVGANIAKYRNSIGMSQVDFAATIHRAQGTISQYESGQRMPSTPIIAEIAKVLGVSFADLYFSDEERANREPFIDDTLPAETFTNEERQLVRAYRNALPEIRHAALQMLELNPIVKKKSHA